MVWATPFKRLKGTRSPWGNRRAPAAAARGPPRYSTPLRFDALEDQQKIGKG